MAHGSCPQEQLHVADFLAKHLPAQFVATAEQSEEAGEAPKEAPTAKRQKGEGEVEEQ